MSRTAAWVTALAIVLVAAVATTWMLMQGGLIGPRAAHVRAEAALAQLVVVPATDGGCPGEQFRAPSASVYAPTPGSDGSRSDALIAFGGVSRFVVVCLGSVADRGDAPARADAVSKIPAMTNITRPAPAHNALGETITYTNRLGTDQTVREWQVDKDGWAYVVGGWHRADTPDVDALVDQMISTWEWLPAAPTVTSAG